MHTAGTFTQGKPNTDAEIFISALDAFIASGAGIVQGALGISGLVGMKIPASITGVLQLAPSGLLLRTGILQSTNYANNTSQEAYGTANGPGPSAVAGTSGPGGFNPNAVIPPILTVNLPTLTGSKSGFAGKGIQINWVDYIYSVATLAATSINAAISKFVVPVGNDSSVANTALSANTSLSAVVNSTTAKVHRQRVTLTTPAMITDDAAVLSIQFQAVTPATSVVTLAGVVLGCNFNFN